MAELPEPRVRLLRDSDWTELDTFRCSTGIWFEDDVEEVIRDFKSLYEWRQPHTRMRILVLEHPQSSALLAFGAHEESLQTPIDRDEDVVGTYLHTAAVSLDHQGQRIDVDPFEDEEEPPSVGRYLLQALVDDAKAQDRPGRIHATAARENKRSLVLCDRINLTWEREDPDERFIQRWQR